LDKTVSSTNGVGKTGYLDPFLLVQKSIPNGSKTLNVRPESLKRLQENTGKNLEDTGIGNPFLNRTLRK
jgi:hypothetical protein